MWHAEWRLRMVGCLMAMMVAAGLLVSPRTAPAGCGGFSPQRPKSLLQHGGRRTGRPAPPR